MDASEPSISPASALTLALDMASSLSEGFVAVGGLGQGQKRVRSKMQRRLGQGAETRQVKNAAPLLAGQAARRYDRAAHSPWLSSLKPCT